MTYASDDLTPQLAQQATGAMRHGTGRLLSFNPETFANTVEYRGVVLRNLPVLSGTDALSWRPGDVVALDRWDATGRQGAASYAIKGRYIVPGTGASERAVAFLRGELARQITLEVFGAAIHQQFVADSDSLSDTNDTWVDLSTSGPVVSGVTVGDTGRVLVFVGATITCNNNTDNNTLAQGAMSFEVTGATSQAPDIFERSYRVSTHIFTSGTDTMEVNTGGNAVNGITVTGLNPGVHTFTAKYQAITSPLSPPTAPVHFSNRKLMVIPF